MKEVGKKKGWAQILETRKIEPLRTPHIHLALSIPRFHKMDWIIEKAVELGAAQLHPFVSENSFVRKIDGQLTRRRSRWEKIVQGATQQSGRGELMGISEPCTLDQLLERFNQQASCRGLFPYEGVAPVCLAEEMENQKKSADFSSIKSFWIFVGSEGGFSLSEVERFKEVGLSPVTMGEQILRVDTACVALLSVIKYELGLM